MLEVRVLENKDLEEKHKMEIRRQTDISEPVLDYGYLAFGDMPRNEMIYGLVLPYCEFIVRGDGQIQV